MTDLRRAAPNARPSNAGHDAVLVLSFGGPEGPDDVMPFLRNVVRGRNVPDERLATVAEQYEQFGGVSPINAQNRALIDALVPELAEHGIQLPVYFGNRNWHPFLADTLRTMAEDGIRSALVFVTSAFGSYSGCRQYRQDLVAAASIVGESHPSLHIPELRKLRLFYNHPGFIEAAAERLRDAIDSHPLADGEPRVVFTAHSIPVSMADQCDYEQQLRESARLIAAAVGMGDSDTWDLAFQSRSGPPHIPWLEPDIGDHLRRLADEATQDVIIAPLGFVSDHMEVLFDLDVQAAAIADGLGIRVRRASTVGTHPRFVAMIRELIEEQLRAAPRLFIGRDDPWPDFCPEGHCLAPDRQEVQRAPDA